MSSTKAEILKALQSGDFNQLLDLYKKSMEWPFEALNEQGAISIHILAQQGNIDNFYSLLVTEPRLINKVDYRNQTALHYAALSGHNEIVELAAESGIDLEKKVIAPGEAIDGQTALDYAKAAHHPLCIQALEHRLLKIAIKKNKLDYIQNSLLTIASNKKTVFSKKQVHPVHLAVKTGNQALLELLLNTNPSLINVQDKQGLTPLHWAILKNKPLFIQFLIQKGADIQQTTSKVDGKRTPLALAQEERRLDCVCILQKAQLNLALQEYKDFNNCNSAEIWIKACQEGWIDIVEFLLNKGLQIPFSKPHPIHIASEYGHLDIIKLFIENDPKVIQLQDDYHNTVLSYAFFAQQTHVVAFLLDQEHFASLLNDPENWEKVYRQALSTTNARIVNLILLKKAGDNFEAIVDFTLSGTKALDMMLLKPEVVPMLMQNAKICAQIARLEGLFMDESQIEYYQPSTKSVSKRHSFYLNIDRKTNTSSCYVPCKELGKGKYGKVRLFKNSEGDKRAVKSLKKPMCIYKNNWLDYDVEPEKVLSQKTNPDVRYTAFKFFTRKQRDNLYDYRLIMPYFKGYSAKGALSKADSIPMVAAIVLAIAKTLDKIHKNGVLHNDLHSKNIRIQLEPYIKVRFIDSGLSSLLDGTDNYHCNINGKKWIAPELIFEINERRIKSDPSQDIYALGYMLDSIFDTLPTNVYSDFPSIQSFIQNALRTEPGERPKLEDFHLILKEELRQYNKPDDSQPPVNHEGTLSLGLV